MYSVLWNLLHIYFYMFNGSFTKVFHLLHGCSWRWWTAAAGSIYAGLLLLPLFTPSEESDEFHWALHLPVVIKMKNHTSFLLSIPLTAPPASLNLRLPLTHVKLPDLCRGVKSLIIYQDWMCLQAAPANASSHVTLFIDVSCWQICFVLIQICYLMTWI